MFSNKTGIPPYLQVIFSSLKAFACILHCSPLEVLFGWPVNKYVQRLLLLLQLWAIIPVVGEEDCEGCCVGLRKMQVTVHLLHIGPYTLYVRRKRVIIEIDDFTWQKRHQFSCQIAGSSSGGREDKILLLLTQWMADPAEGFNRGGQGWLWL